MVNYSDKVIQNINLAKKLAYIEDDIECAARDLFVTLKKGGTIYIAGNAGAGSNAEHFVSELMGRFYHNRKAIRSVSLNSDTTTITCIANDFGFEQIFARQLEGLFNPDKDMFIGMSTSGNSKNIIAAVEYINSVNGKSIIMTDELGGRMHRYTDDNMRLVKMPITDTPRVQESHMFVLHYWAEYIEHNYFRNGEE
jgi:D-sedoheptulose 7-phosphate isomerase